jgi:acyl carrier protein
LIRRKQQLSLAGLNDRPAKDQINAHGGAMQEARLTLSESERKLRRAFADGLKISEDKIDENLQYASTSGWDSIAHMALIASLDSVFEIMLETDDVLELSSYGKAREILRKYGVEF